MSRKIITVSDSTKRTIASTAGKLQITEGQVIDLLMPMLQMAMAHFGVDETTLAAALEKVELYIAGGLISGNSPKRKSIDAPGIEDVKGVDEI